MAVVSREDLDDLRNDLRQDLAKGLEASATASETRMNDLREWLKVTLAPVTQPNPWREVVSKALTPSTLVLLLALVAVLVGGTPVAVMVVDRYLPAKPASNVQINSNNAAEEAAPTADE